MVRIAVACLLFVPFGLQSPPARAADADANALAAQARKVLKTHCSRCHRGPGSDSGYDFDVLSVKTLTEPKGEEVLAPGKSGDSKLWLMIEQGRMPPRKAPERANFGAPEKAALKRWIEAGAPDFSQATQRTFLTLDRILTTIRDHLRGADREKRPYLRYFTLHHLHNNSNVPDADLFIYRAALSKALNSLSWKSRIVVPAAIDKERTLFVIDVRDLDWDRNNLWQEVLKEYPYGLKYRNHPQLQKLDEEIGELTGCDLVLVRADWFVGTATRPPLYHVLLQLPHNAAALEKSLNVEIAANFLDPKPERLARGGFAKSGVSGQNRVVERNDAANGAYWKSYDFKPGNPRSKLTRFPLGPLNLAAHGRHPFPDQAFVHDGGEIIFHLPNGLQGYLLVNGQDGRIDEGPIQVVGDALKTSGTPAIVTGVSCMACHKHGVIPFTDTIRGQNAVFGAAEHHLQQLYPTAETMNRLLQEDEARFLTALEKAVGPFLRVGADAQKPIKEFAEPIGEVARSYRLNYLDLKTVALELDVPDPAQIVKTVGATKLKRLGLDGLLQEGGVISRLDWEAVDGVSLMQELARELRYTPWGLVK